MLLYSVHKMKMSELRCIKIGFKALKIEEDIQWFHKIQKV